MSDEVRTVLVAITVPDSDALRQRGFDTMPDKVVEELTSVVETAVRNWYNETGKDLLRTEPTVC